MGYGVTCDSCINIVWDLLFVAAIFLFFPSLALLAMA
jgi:hypothetical protein